MTKLSIFLYRFHSFDPILITALKEDIGNYNPNSAILMNIMVGAAGGLLIVAMAELVAIDIVALPESVALIEAVLVEET